MFGLFKSKEMAEKESLISEIVKTLFQQISMVRDKVNAGIINENVFLKGFFQVPELTLSRANYLHEGLVILSPLKTIDT